MMVSADSLNLNFGNKQGGCQAMLRNEKPAYFVRYLRIVEIFLFVLPDFCMLGLLEPSFPEGKSLRQAFVCRVPPQVLGLFVDDYFISIFAPNVNKW